MAFRIKRRESAPTDSTGDGINIEDNSSGTNLDGYNTDVNGGKNVVAT